MTTIGHNTIAADQLKSIISRIENLEEQKSDIAQDIKDIYAESKGAGFDNKAIKAIIKLRALDASTREEQQAVLDAYMHALGMLPGSGEEA